MEFKIKLFVHGVPYGKNIWRRPDAEVEQNYFNTFYTGNAGIAPQMLVDVREIGGLKSAYYTYVFNNGNVLDSANRKGGYMALTLRMNCYYADIQNIYNLLDAAFNKYIVGSVVQFNREGACRFLISEFNQVSDHLAALEKELQHYLMQFSSNNDLVSLDAFAISGMGECGIVNLSEALPNVVCEYVRKNGMISISPLYPSTRENEIIQANEKELRKVRAQAEKDVQAAKKDKEDGIRDITAQYAGMAASYKTLQSDLQQANQNKEDLGKQVSALKQQLNQYKNAQANYDLYKQQKEQYEAMIGQIQKVVGNVCPIMPGQSGPKRRINLAPINLVLNVMIAFFIFCFTCAAFFGGCGSHESYKPISENKMIQVVDSIVKVQATQLNGETPVWFKEWSEEMESRMEKIEGNGQIKRRR